MMNKSKKGLISEDKYIAFHGKKYAINLTELKKVCFNSSMFGDGTKEIEISQAYERQENGEFELSSKLEHETKLIGNSQNDMAIYDIVKLLLVCVLENNMSEEDFFETLSLSVALNTLINWGILIEVE